uniref:Secreted protein n=1 Tax=Ascaris lumbricoides TaxID=6252 RepID=A0A0M3I4J7_ASCLU
MQLPPMRPLWLYVNVLLPAICYGLSCYTCTDEKGCRNPVSESCPPMTYCYVLRREYGNRAEKLPTAEVVLGYNQGIDEGANIGGNIGGSYGGAAGSYGIGGIGSGSGYGSYSYGPIPGQGNGYGSLQHHHHALHRPIGNGCAQVIKPFAVFFFLLLRYFP